MGQGIFRKEIMKILITVIILLTPTFAFAKGMKIIDARSFHAFQHFVKAEELTQEEIDELLIAENMMFKAEWEFRELKDKIAKKHKIEGERNYRLDGKYIIEERK